MLMRDLLLGVLSVVSMGGMAAVGAVMAWRSLTKAGRLLRVRGRGVVVETTLKGKRSHTSGEGHDYWVMLGWRDDHGWQHVREFSVSRGVYRSADGTRLLIDPADSEFAVIDRWFYRSPLVSLGAALIFLLLATVGTVAVVAVFAYAADRGQLALLIAGVLFAAGTMVAALGSLVKRTTSRMIDRAKRDGHRR